MVVRASGKRGRGFPGEWTARDSQERPHSEDDDIRRRAWRKIGTSHTLLWGRQCQRDSKAQAESQRREPGKKWAGRRSVQSEERMGDQLDSEGHLEGL